MSLVSMTFRGVMLHRDIGWPEHSMALVIVRHDTRQFMASLMGYAASAAVLGTFLMRRMVPLRMLAILSNVLFVAYGYAEQIYPVLCLHIALLPINVQRLLTSMARLEQAPGLPLRPIRPIDSVSPIWAMPTTSMANTSGAMIILINRRNRSVMMVK